MEDVLGAGPGPPRRIPVTAAAAKAGRRGRGALGGALALLLVLLQAGPAFGAGSVSGTVLGTGGAPVQGICVSAESALLPDPAPPSTTTGPSGSYILSGVPAGLHAVRFRDCRAGGEYVTESFPGAVDPAGAALVRVQNSLTTTGVGATLDEGGTIAGTVSDGVSGLADACVTATPTGPGSAGTAVTAGDGSYAITGLVPGAHRVRFESCDALLHEPDGVFATEWHPNTSDPAASATVTVTAGLTSAGIDASLDPAAHITGSVSDSVPVALAGICVSARRSGTTVARATTGAGGAYDIGGLRAGASYELLFAPGCGPDPQPNVAPRWYDGRTSEAAADPVLAGGVADATLPGGAAVSGVVDDGSSPLAGICVRAYASGDSSTALGLAITDVTGAYALTGLAAGSVKLSFVDCSASPSFAREWNGGAASFAAASPVALTEGSTATVDAQLGADSAAPVTTITGGPLGSVASTAATLTFQSGEPDVSHECRLDGGAWTACGSPHQLSGLAQGAHTFQVRGTDAAGNTEDPGPSRTWTVDTVAPDTSVTSGPSGPTSDHSPSFGFSSSEGGSTFECRLDGGAWSACTSPKAHASLTDGAHTFEVRATDAAGNLDGSPASRAFTVDTLPPDTSISSGPSGPTSNASPSFGFGGSGGAVSFECRLDGDVWAACVSPKSYVSLSEAAHTFEVRAFDAAGNPDPVPASRSFTVDTTEPATTLGPGPASPTNSTSASLTFSSPDGTASFECRLDAGAWGACTSPQGYSSLAEGSHTFQVRAKDPAGNLDSTPESHTWTIDTTPPDTSITSGPSGPTNDASPSFAFTGTGSPASFECRLDGGAWETCVSPKGYTALADGSHTFEVRAEDAAGNPDPSPVSRSFTVDTTAPETTFGTGPASPTNSTSASLTFSSPEGTASFQCRLDAGGWVACSSPEAYSGLSNGAHTFQVRAVDAVGNADASPASHVWTVDTAAPETSITSAPASLVGSSSASFSFSSSEGGSSFECRLDAGAWGACTSPRGYSSLAEGAHTFEVRAEDPAGNVDASPASHAWTVDTLPPDTSISSGPVGPTNDASPSFGFGGSGGAVSFECRMDGGAWGGCTSPHAYASLSEAAHTFEVRAFDAAGNPDPSPATRSFTVDVTEPATTFGSGPSSPTNSTSASLTFSSPDGTASFECRLDAGAWGACTSPQGYSSLAEGSHTFQVRAKDPAGNVDTTPPSHTWIVDTTPPDTSITSGPAGPTNDDTPQFEFSGSGGAVSFECRLDGGALVSCASPATIIAALPEGAHTFEVRAIDAAGNADPTFASRAFTVDVTVPPTTLTSGPAILTNSTSASLSFSSTDGSATFECRIDGSAWAGCTSPKAYPSLTAGLHTFEVRAKDPAGNVDATPASHVWTVDTAAPETSITSAPASLVGSSSASFSFSSSEGGSSFECRLDAGAWGACTSPQGYSSLAEGAHTFEVRAEDPAGNVDASPASHAWTVDTLPPDTSISSGPVGPTNDASPSFVFGGSGGAVSFECRLDGGAWGPCTSPRNYASLSEAAHTFEVRAFDAAGNPDPSPATRSFTVDVTEPATTFGSGPSSPTNSTSASLTFSSPDGTASFECRLDAGAWGACTSPQGYSSLAEGSHTFQVRAKDPAGNLDSTPSSHTWTIDTTPPATTFGTGPPSLTNGNSASLTFSSPEGTATFECRLDGGAFTACASPAVYTALVDGSHTFEVRARDQAGNADPTAASHTWTVDTTAPATTFGSGPPTPTNSTSASLSFSSPDAGASFECSLDGASYSGCTSPRNYAGPLAEGPHTFLVRARDAAGNVDETPAAHTWTIDLTPPDTSISAGPADPTNSTSATFSFSGSGGAVSYECRLGAGVFVPCLSGIAYSSLAAGSYTFEVRARDAAGNVDPSPASFTWTVDLTAPETSVSAGPSGPTNNASPSFSFSSADGTASFECRIDGGAFAACSSPHAYSSLSEGAHTFEVRAKDPAGNVDGSPASRSFTVDVTAPATSLTGTPVNPSSSASASFSFSSTDGTASFECRLDGGAFTACSSPHVYGSLAEGAHTFDVRAKDPAGNVDGSPASFAWVVDLTAPDTSVTAGPNGPTNNASPSFSFSSTDGTASFECRLDAGAWGACSSPQGYAALSEGAHTFQVRARDLAGNVDGSPASRSFTVDVTAPATTLTGTPANPSNSASASLTFSSDDGTATFQCRLDGGAWGACSSPQAYGSLAEGAHVFEVRAVDPAGNLDPTPAAFAWTVDLTAPDTAISSGPSGPTNSASPSFAFSSPDATASFECRLDGGAWGACTSPRAYSSLAEGAHTFEARAKDPAGNTDASPASRSFTVDVTAPDTSLTGMPANPSSSASASFSFSSADGSASFECRIDGGAWGACTSPKAHASLPEGSHTFDVRAKDPAGNVDGSPASFTWTVDLTTPDTLITASPANPSSSASASFSFSSPDGTASFECRIDGGAFAACTSPRVHSSLGEGVHTFEVRARDAAGNIDGSPAALTWTVDLTAPDTSITATPANPSNSASASFSFSSADGTATFECRIDGGTWGACTSPRAFSALTEGSHTVDVRARDLAGNADGSPASFTWTVDLTTPDTSITTGPSGPTNNASPAFAFQSPDATATFECRIDGGAWGACTTPKAYASLTEAAHTFEVRARDAAGNIDASPATRTFTVDVTAPGTTLAGGPADPTSSTAASLTFSSADPTASFECSLDGAAFAACSSPKAYTALAEGAHSFLVRARDSAGNVDATPATHAWTVDVTAPDTLISAGPSGPTSDATPTFTFSSPDATATFECRVDGGTFAACSTGVTLPALAEGAHTFDVRARDAAANIDGSPASRSFTVDLTAPETAVTSGPAGPVSSTSASFAFSSEAGASFECRIDGGGWSACTSPKGYTALSEAAHTFEVRAKDPAGNTDASPASRSFTVDVTAPDTSIDSAPQSPTNATTVTLGFSSNETGATFECSLDAGLFAPCSAGTVYSGLAQGSHTVNVRAIDAAGNVDGSPDVHTWTIDLTPPGTSITSAPADPTNSTSASFSFDSPDPGATFECKLDAAAFAACVPGVAYSTLGQGAHTFQVRAKDPAGNLDPTPASYTWAVDTTVPDTSLTGTPANPSNSASASFSFSSADATASFECRLDGGAWGACTSPKAHASLAEGAHTFDVRAKDPAGNVDASPASFTWTVDLTAPETAISSGPSGPTNGASPSFGFSSPDGTASFECRLDGGAWAACSSPKAYASLAEGAHTFEVRAKDPAGNLDGSPASRSFTVDVTAPPTTLTSTPPDPTNSTSASLAFSSTDATATFECRLDGAAWSACTSPRALSSLAQGAHTFEVRAKDPAGNLDATPAAHTWAVDTTVPDTSLTGTPANPSNSASASFSFSSADATASFECRLDGGAWGACTSPRALASLAEGAHTFDVRAKDPAGNIDASPASFTWTVDLTAPDAAISSGPSGPTNSASPSFGFSSPDGTASFECRLDGGAWAACTSPKAYASLAEGAHTFEVRAKDPAGNTDASPASRSFTVDVTAPPTSLTSTPANPSAVTSASFAFSSTDATATFECRLDGGTWGACTSPKAHASLAEGAHTFDVRARDAAGNVDGSPASFTWTVDLTAPDTAITSGPSGPTNSASPSFGLSSADGTATFECRLDGGAWAACTSPRAYASLAEGAHTFEVRAKDLAGNVDGSPAARSFTVDVTAPPTTLTSTPAVQSNSASASLAFTSADATATFECRLDGGAWAACTSPRAYASLAEGAHTFDVRAKDPAGNLDATAASHTWTVDLTAPDTSVSSGPSGPTNQASPSFAFTSADGTASFECRLDGGSWGACTSPKAYASLAEGAHSFDVRARDAAGNIDGSPASRSFTVDVTPPDTSFTSGPNGGVAVAAPPTYTFTSSDGTATFECRTDAGAWAACSSPRTLSGLSTDGEHTFDVRAKDPAGNVDATPAGRLFTLDTTAPDTSAGAGPPSPTNSTSASLTFSSPEAGAGFDCRIDGGTWAACTSPQAYSSLAEGQHTFEARAKDSLGNADGSPASVTWTVDTTAPETTLGPEPPAIGMNVSPSFTFSSPDASATFECRLDGSPFEPCASPKEFEGLTDGEHTFEARALDPAGNADATAASLSWFLDGTAPNTVISGGPTGTSPFRSAAISFHSADFESSFECKLDGAQWESCESPYMTDQPLDPGIHMFRVRSRDVVGNVDATPAERGWKVEPGWTGPVSAAGSARPHKTVALQPVDGIVEPLFPLAAAVTAGSVAGGVDITIEPAADTLAGYTLLGRRIEITAPEASVDDPLVIKLTIDPSLAPPGAGVSDLTVLRDGVPAGRCTSPSAATPDPCVAEHMVVNGAMVLIVRSSHASVWHVAKPDPPPPAPPAAAQSTVTQTTPTPKAVAPKPKRCKVPRLRGMTLAAARKALTKAGCKLGTVGRKRRPTGRNGTVLTQKVPAGRSVSAGTRIAVVLVSRAKRPAQKPANGGTGAAAAPSGSGA